MLQTNAIVAIYESHTEAEAAVKELYHGGFDMKTLSIVARDYHSEDEVIGYYTTGDRMKAWGKLGDFWGELWDILFGWGFFFIPGIGPVVIGGPLVSSVLSALEKTSALGGLSAFGAGLAGMGIPKNSVFRYEAALMAGKFLLVAQGTCEEVEQARRELNKTTLTEAAVHQAA
jgi:hypothetical protein